MVALLTQTTVCGFSLYQTLAYFLIYSCLGWCLEVVYAAVTTGKLVNRGFLNGPVCPIYGFGMVIVLYALTPLVDNTLLLYLGGVILPSALELVGGWALYKLYRTRWWDYSDYPFNIGGYICLEFCLLWGVGTLVVMRIVHPIIAGLAAMVPTLVGVILMCILYAVYATDVVATAIAASTLADTLDTMEKLGDSIYAVSDAMTELLCTIANAARKFFVSSRIYRVGGDEFVVLTPNLPPYDVWTASDRIRVFLREKDCEISVGIQNTNNLRKLEAAVNKAEQAMQQDKLAYYGRNGQERQLKGLNEKLERTLTQKRDAEHFLRVLAPKYRSVYVVNLQEDSARPIIIPDFFQKILDTSGGSFRAVITAYRDQYVVPESHDAFNRVLDYSFVRSKVLSGEIVEVHYTRTDGAPYTLKITPYSSSGSHIHETIWIFADDTATLTPPPDAN